MVRFARDIRERRASGTEFIMMLQGLFHIPRQVMSFSRFIPAGCIAQREKEGGPLWSE